MTQDSQDSSDDPSSETTAVVHKLADERAPLLSPLSPRPTNKMSRAAYGLGHVLNDVCASMWFSYTLLFLHAVIGMPGTHAGSVLMLGQIVDALATPLVGIVADKSPSGFWAKYGRRKLCHLAGTALVLCSFPFIFMPCWMCDVPLLPRTTENSEINVPVTFGPLPSDETAKVEAAEAAAQAAWWQQMLYYTPLVAVFQIGWAAVQIAHLSLIPDLTSNEHERTELTAIRYSMSVCSSVVVYMITWSVLHVTRSSPRDTIGPEDAYKFKNIVLIGVSLGSIFTFLFHLGLKEPMPSCYRKQLLNTAKRDKGKDIRLVEFKTTSAYFRDPRLYQAALLYVSSRLFTTLSQVFVPLYLDEYLGEDAESIALVPLATFLASFVASLAVKSLNKRCGRMLTYLIGALLCLIGCVWIYLGSGPSYEEKEIYVVALFLGSGSSVTLVTSLCITADLIGGNTDSGAAIYSAVTFADKLFNGLAVMLIESLKCADRRACPHYYRDAVALVCGGTVLFGLIVVATYWKPTCNRFFNAERANLIP